MTRFSIEESVELILNEGEAIGAGHDSAEANFMPGVRQACRDLEHTHGSNLVRPTLNLLNAYDQDNPAIGPLIGTIVRNVRTRQSLYQDAIATLRPEGLSDAERENPQLPRPSEFDLAAKLINTKELKYDNALIALVERALGSTYQGVVYSALRASEAISIESLAEACFKLFQSGSDEIKPAALFSAAQLSCVHPDRRQDIFNLIYTHDVPSPILAAAFEAALTSLPVPEAQNIVKSDQKDVVDMLAGNPPLIAGLLDLATQQATEKAVQAFHQVGLDDTPPTVLRRLARSPFVDEKMRQMSADAVAMSDARDIEVLTDKFSAAVHRNGDITTVYVGHAGLSVSSSGDRIIDCTVGRDPQAVKQISLSEWKAGTSDCWGFRLDKPRLADLAKTVKRAKTIASWRTRYDDNHLNQKGEWFSGSGGGPRFWEADCVGFVEHCYEHAGGNPTRNTYETGAGWPLTVREQRDGMEKIGNC